MLDLFTIGNFIRCKRCGKLYEVVLAANGQKDTRDVPVTAWSKPVADATVEFCTCCWSDLERQVMQLRARRVASGELAN
jgi:hypothetical protein